MKVLHLPSSVAGNSWGLSRGERALGLESDVLVLYESRYGYPADRVLFPGNPPGPAGKLLKRLNIPVLLKEARAICRSYDVFHFNFGSSLIDLWMLGLPLLDLPLYRDKGKIIVTYNGCDARQRDRTIERTRFSPCHNESCSRLCSWGITTHRNRKGIEKFDRFADTIFALNPDLMHVLPERARFLPYTIPRWWDISETPANLSTTKLTIAHAPTSRATKGSVIILAALEKLKKTYGDRIEVILVENVPHDKALALYRNADLVIDQVLIGFYGAVAVEAMKMGKPVMAYLREDDLGFMPGDMAADCREALIRTDPATIFETLCGIVENPGILERHREAGLAYVHRWHDPAYVAGITKAAYES